MLSKRIDAERETPGGGDTVRGRGGESTQRRKDGKDAEKDMTGRSFDCAQDRRGEGAKRIFDIVVSALVILIALPLWAVVAVAITVDSAGPVFYRGERVGKDGERFRIYKFRTMVEEADRKGPGITTGEDARITRVGRFLRRMKIDEMPQLINVLKGEMSIMGPRPEDPRQREVLRVRPGMASPAFIKYRHEEEILEAAGEDWEAVYVERVLPDKLEMDLEYVERQSLGYDLGIFGEAAVSLFSSSDGTQINAD
jgi:lipopolysaccharide/colanic/teichoic acid biosynthesis glycosyltransferase